VATDRSAEDIQREIEQARASLATTVDELAVRTSPKRILNDTKQTLLAQAQSPRGKAVIGGAAALVAILIVARVRSVRRRRSAD
jgi:Protein of unknown function (DUF3618)